MKLLTVSNAKISKTNNLYNKTHRECILHLLPHKLSGKNTCSSASIGCSQHCLNTSGFGRYPSVQKGRLRKTKLLFDDRKEFERLLSKDIESFIAKCKKLKVKPVIRLNGTSDLDWEKLFPGIHSKYKEALFMDYTKIKSRMDRFLDGKLSKNYHLTFSQHEKNKHHTLDVLKRGGNVAVIFDKLPRRYLGYPVVDADKHDLRFKDKKGVVCGLLPKGRAKHDTTGFVVRVPPSEEKKS